ncbi:hypothetical protein GEMRC1_005507 [Eukaryota sp. GEM-RC1]
MPRKPVRLPQTLISCISLHLLRNIHPSYNPLHLCYYIFIESFGFVSQLFFNIAKNAFRVFLASQIHVVRCLDTKHDLERLAAHFNLNCIPTHLIIQYNQDLTPMVQSKSQILPLFHLSHVTVDLDLVLDFFDSFISVLSALNLYDLTLDFSEMCADDVDEEFISGLQRLFETTNIERLTLKAIFHDNEFSDVFKTLKTSSLKYITISNSTLMLKTLHSFIDLIDRLKPGSVELSSTVIVCDEMQYETLTIDNLFAHLTMKILILDEFCFSAIIVELLFYRSFNCQILSV